MNNKRIGFAICGSFCTHSLIPPVLSKLKSSGYLLTPILSETVYSTDTRFGNADDFRRKIEEICENECIKSIKEAEPIGPRKTLDALIIAPCTGNTLAKLACGIADTSVTMAAKAHLRNERPLIIAPSTNDALGAAAKNIGLLLNSKHIFFVPFGQDSPDKKHRSCVADFTKIPETLSEALENRQLQPIIFQNTEQDG